MSSFSAINLKKNFLDCEKQRISVNTHIFILLTYIVIKTLLKNITNENTDYFIFDDNDDHNCPYPGCRIGLDETI